VARDETLCSEGSVNEQIKFTPNVVREILQVTPEGKIERAGINIERLPKSELIKIIRELVNMGRQGIGR
jgi:predicted metallopeptidase